MNFPTKTPNKFTRISSADRGFTLVEILLVIVVIGIIAGIAIPRLLGAVKAANQGAAISAIRLITNLEMSQINKGDGIQSIDKLIESTELDSAFTDSDGNPNTGLRSGYIFLITPTGTDTFILSAVPQNTGLLTATGSQRYGTDSTGVIYADSQTIDTPYTTSGDLTAGTSAAYQP